MSLNAQGPGPRTRVRRLPKKASYDAALIYAIFDEARFCHVAAVVDGRAVALPTLHAREGNTLYFHANQSNAVLRAVLASGEACVTATLFDGLRLARSGFESSIAYRSVVAFGAVDEVVDDTSKAEILDRFVDSVIPGRSAEVRPMTEQERRLTLVVALRIEEASAKVSAGPTEDDEADQQLPIWSGTVPARLVFDRPEPSSDGAMAVGDIEVPASVRALVGDG